MNKQQDPEAAETVQTTKVPAVDLPQLVLGSSDHPTPRTDAVINTFDGNAPRLADKLATLAEEMERERAAAIHGWRSKASQLLAQAEAMELRASHQGEHGSPAASMWRAVAMCLNDCARELSSENAE